MARHTSTSRPRHSPFASGVENPATPVVTPHWRKSLRRTPSIFGVAIDPRACASAAAGGAAVLDAALEHADSRTARQQIHVPPWPSTTHEQPVRISCPHHSLRSRARAGLPWLLTGNA